MNGRALNEKAIEVSPSSQRVLERASDILVPFPPSKNRPRPGDWTCPSCGFSNFQRRTACFRCSFPAVSAGPTGDMGYGGGGGGGGYGYGPPQQMMGPPHHSHGGHHGHMGHGGGRMGGGSGVVPFRAGDWKCGNEMCGYHNFAKNVCCLRCGASRHNAAVVADSGYPTPGMDTPASSYMGSGSMAGTPGPGQYGGGGGGGGGFGSAGGYGHGQQQQQYGPPSTYALPSGLGAGAAPYPAGLIVQPGPFGPAPPHQSAGQFDHRAEAAFNSGNNLFHNAPAPQDRQDPFAFLASSMGDLQVSGPGQNGGGAPAGASASRSPAN